MENNRVSLNELENTERLLIDIAGGLSNLCVHMVQFQAAADAVLKRLKEVFPEGASVQNFAGEEATAVYEPGPPQAFGFILPDAPPRLEVYWGAWPGVKAYAEVRDHWRGLVRAAVEKLRLEGGLPKEPLNRAAVFFTFYISSSQPWDVDNYAMRFVINALRHERILVDDSFDRLTVAARGVQGSPTRTEVVLIERPELAFAAMLNSKVGRKILPKMEAKLALKAPQKGDFLLE